VRIRDVPHYLAGELPSAIGFLALATKDTVDFGCTIQKGKAHAQDPIRCPRHLRSGNPGGPGLHLGYGQRARPPSA